MSNQGELTALIQRMQSGDSEAMNSLYREMEVRLRKIASKLMQRESRTGTFDTSDLMQESLIKNNLLGKNIRVNDREHFFAIVRRKMGQILIDRSRNRRARKRQVEAINDQTRQRVEQLHDLRAARKRLLALDRKAYQVLLLRNDFGLSWEEVSLKLNMPIWEARRDHAFAIEWLRQQL